MTYVCVCVCVAYDGSIVQCRQAIDDIFDCIVSVQMIELNMCEFLENIHFPTVCVVSENAKMRSNAGSLVWRNANRNRNILLLV